MKIFPSWVGLLILAGCATAPEPTRLREPVSWQSGFSFSRPPTPAVWPQGAVGEQGFATIICTVGDHGRLADCRATDETPSGRGVARSLIPGLSTARIKLEQDGPAVGDTVEVEMVVTKG
jgi:hypothetical protein